MGVAIDSRETAGSAAELLLRHFDQITPENHMKPEAWYDAERDFGVHPEADAIMDVRAGERAATSTATRWSGTARRRRGSSRHDAGDAADDQRGRPAVPARPPADAHLRRRRDAERRRTGRSAARPTRSSRSTSSTRSSSDAATSPTGCGAATGTTSSARSTSTSRSATRTRPSTRRTRRRVATRPVMLFINDYNTEQAGKRRDCTPSSSACSRAACRSTASATSST